MTVFHNLCRECHEITAPPLDCARSGYLHTICSVHCDSDGCLNNTWPSFHTDRIGPRCRLTNNPCSSCARKPHQFHQRLQVSRLQIASVPSGFHAVVRISDFLHGVRARFIQHRHAAFSAISFCRLQSSEMKRTNSSRSRLTHDSTADLQSVSGTLRDRDVLTLCS